MAIKSSMNWMTYLSPAISKQVVTDYLRRLPGNEGVLDQLTSRQREVLQLVAEGYTTKEIAAKLRVSEKTIQSHRLQLMQKLRVHDVATLVRFAVRSGIVDRE